MPDPATPAPSQDPLAPQTDFERKARTFWSNARALVPTRGMATSEFGLVATIVGAAATVVKAIVDAMATEGVDWRVPMAGAVSLIGLGFVGLVVGFYAKSRASVKETVLSAKLGGESPDA